MRLSTPWSWLAWVAGSAVLGLLLTRSTALATLHLGATLVAVVAVGLFASRPAPILAVTLYAGLCDVLWRANSAMGPYEAAKYAVIVGSTLLVVRFVRRPRHLGLVVGLILLLVPGALITIAKLGPAVARELVSANIAGLIAIGCAVLACGSLRLTLVELRGLYLVVLGPVVALTASATIGTLEESALDFSNEANFATSAGFGPNQVSSLLGLGALLCALVALQPRAPWRLRVLSVATAVWLVGQMVLTFSRGGVFGLVLALIGIGLTALFSTGQRTRTIVAAAVFFVLGLQVMSWAGVFTEGASEERFASTDATNRWDIAAADIDLFTEQPLFGVGAGMARYEREFRETAAHTEYTRLLAEHGFLGVGVLVILGALAIILVRAGVGWYRMATVGLLVMAFSQMTHSATRIGSIAVAFGLAAILEDRE